MCRDSLRSGLMRPVLAQPTGSGKTVVAAYMCRSARDRGKRSIFIVNALALIRQTIRTFSGMGMAEDIGVIQSKHPMEDDNKLVQIATIQTLAAWLKKWPGRFETWSVDLIIIDECDQQYDARDLLAGYYADKPIIGLTATPLAKGMGLFYTNLLKPIGMQELIDRGFLSDYKIFAPSAPDLTGVKTVGKDYAKGGSADKYDRVLRADIIKSWRELGENRKTLGFAPTVAMSKQMALEFNQAGIPAAHIDGYGQSDEAKAARAKIFEDFEAGIIKVLWSVNITARGYDHPEVGCLIVARPTKSRSLWIQMLGRVLRRFEGKEYGIVLDHSTNTERLGEPTAPLPDELCDGSPKSNKDKPKKDEPLPTICPSCFGSKPPGVSVCPHCGFAPEARTPIITKEGKLVEITKRGKEKVVGFTPEFKDAFYSQLLGLAHQRGNTKGWAYNAYKKKFKEEPSQYIMHKSKPGDEVLRWEKHLNIRYARGKANA